MEEFFRLIMTIEETRGMIYGFFGVLFSIPSNILYRYLKSIPQDILLAEYLPLLLSGVGAMCGIALGMLEFVDMSHGIQVGISAGYMSTKAWKSGDEKKNKKDKNDKGN